MRAGRSMRLAISALGVIAMAGWGVPAWAQGGAGEVGSSGGSGNQSSSGASQKGQEMMHQERMQQGFEKDQGQQSGQQQGEASMGVGRPDRNDQSHSQPTAPHSGGSGAAQGSQRGQ